MPQKKRLPDLKTLLLGSKKMESGSYARYPNGTQKLAPVTDIEKGIEAAGQIGYPVLVRPSFVLGGRAMQIVAKEKDLRHYLKTAV